MGNGCGSVENLVIDFSFWKGKTVVVTGHTGFKGSWLSMWLKSLGANVHGYSLAPPDGHNLFHQAKLQQDIASTFADINDQERLFSAVKAIDPQFIFHLAAQSLVLESYTNPIATYATNIMGTANILEASRYCENLAATIVVTSDKCYENKEWLWGYRENEAMGGHDPYSSSKACAELVSAAYRKSFFCDPASPVIATARAGNVIGGGDWAANRLIPDLIRAFLDKQTAQVRNPHSIRPWQHVLEPLSGYLQLAALGSTDRTLGDAWNFGPDESSCLPVSDVAASLADLWSDGANWTDISEAQVHEASLLKLDSSKSRRLLGWRPKLDIQASLQLSVAWYKAFKSGKSVRETTQSQIDYYMDLQQRDE